MTTSPPPSSAYLAALERLLAAPTLPKLGLTRMEALCAALGHPERRPLVLHIAGTKGKGSTSAMAASIARAMGLRVGLTTSPHLLSARERIVIDGALVDEDTFVDLEARVASAAASLPSALEEPSFFERLTAMAFCAFADAAVDVAVVEVGLGGRLDATNVVRPSACAITRLGLDHTEFLGPTIRHIAREKAGIMKAGVPVVSAPQVPEAAAVLEEVARAVGAPLQRVDVGALEATLPVRLAGPHQRENAAVAVAVVRAGLAGVADAAVRSGLAAVQWPGRYETLSTSPRVIVDGAHDGLAMEALAVTLLEDPVVRGRPLHLVLGASTGHPPVELLTPLVRLAPASLRPVAAHHPRAIAAADLAAVARDHFGKAVRAGAAVGAGLAAAMDEAATDGGVVVVTGSLFAVGEARGDLLPGLPRDPARPRY